MYPAQEQNFLQRHCYGGQGFLVTGEVFLITEEVFLVTEEVFLVTEERFVFLFIALRWMQNPIGGML